ncbi:MAG TPA: hypothetical protein VK463_04070 [Desulfomonilaceae bacterium]|nr:hypothetical protein [Desulfomonilaceae bacterium]
MPVDWTATAGRLRVVVVLRGRLLTPLPFSPAHGLTQLTGGLKAEKNIKYLFGVTCVKSGSDFL